MRTRLVKVLLGTLLLSTPCFAHTKEVSPPAGFRPYRATMYGNEKGARARRIATRLPASGIPFRANAPTFAWNGALGNKYKIWTPGHHETAAYCTDCGANHPDLAYGFFHRMYYVLASRHGVERPNADRAGHMIIWLKRIPGHVVKHHRNHD